ncbi:S9 family peptidase [Tissierella creatinini]|nr:S9 family peptidase [Tissierella creatinini]TJX66365.1 S9 family peptidase [Soehngenia saccharolytica]
MENLKLDDFTRYKFISGLTFSPDGKNCGLVIHEIDLEENKYLSNIYILDESHSLKMLTSLGEENTIIWHNNSKVLFPAIRDKKDKDRKEKGEPLTVYYEIDIHGGEAKKSMEIPLNVSSLKFIDDTTYILCAEYNPYLKINGDKEKALKEYKELKDFEILDEIPFWSNGQGYTNKKRNKLYIYKADTKTLLPITDDFTNVESYELNLDKNKIVLITSSFIDKMSIKTKLNLYDINKDRLESISPLEDFNYQYCNFIDDKILFIGSQGKTYGLNENPHIYTTDYTGNKTMKISDLDLSLWNSIGSDCRYGNSTGSKIDKDYLYFTSTEGTCSYINRIDSYGNIEKLSSNKGSIDGFDVKGDKIYFIGLRGLKLQEVYSLKEEELQLTYLNSWVNEKIKLSPPEKLNFITDNSIEIQGWVIKPVDYEAGKKYPGILNIHGGPKTVYGSVFYHEMQVWANEGYFVFFTNPRGSDGYGDAFADIRGKYGTIDYEDIMDFTDLVLINYPDIDKDRIGVTGGSYGGFMTNWIIGHTSRFKAAASQRCISNWLSFFGTSDIGYFFAQDQVSGTPWTTPEKLWNDSPLKYADKVTTPTLFIHSAEDFRCWIPEGLQMFTALKYHGVDSRLVVFKGENHELSRSGKPKSRIRRLKEIIEWFEKYLK